ncbi:hypothetical protein GBA63_04850 [Rubrobacter tropicus]|uniref:Uncharacterized protein n=1 Tax=Rubrobacter tropicus TaxID=2653851 RepID=A0A6G8Q6G4_9ACTN|nr:hypothetical protein [Rubrobacter tropicus]QIN82043.1 hypothetical protein GBA63_04850 [Rubrobacter tropicus]
MLRVEETKARIEQRLGAYTGLLQDIVDTFNEMYEERDYERQIGIAADFDTDWELRVRRNMTEQLQSELVSEVEALRKYAEDLERRVSKTGHDAKNALPRPESEASTQQSSRVRIEAAERLSKLRRARP